MTVAGRQIMIRPRRSGSSVAVERRWFPTMSPVLANQCRDRPVRTRPLSGTPVGSTTSNAEIRSDATSVSEPSSRAYRSRTFPDLRYASASIGDRRGMRGPVHRRLAGALGRPGGETVEAGDSLGNVPQVGRIVEAGVKARQ